jgi:excisionase family DNA binding protein
MASYRDPKQGQALMTEQDLAEYLNFSVETIRDWRKPGREGGPPFKRLGRSVRYDRRDVDKYLERASVDPERPRRR